MALSATAVLDLAMEADREASRPHGNDVRSKRANGALKHRFEFRGRKDKMRKEQRRLQAQVINHNLKGYARTQDHIMTPPLVGESASPRGKGAWKSWTPDAILKVAFMSAETSRRSGGSCVGGSHGHARKCPLVTARIIVDGQQMGLRRLKTLAERSPSRLKFYIANTMFDETRLPVTVEYKGRRKHRLFPILSSHQQVYWHEGDGLFHEEDVARRPVALRRATAGCMWKALERDDSCESFFPSSSPSGFANAEWKGVLFSADGHGTNHLLAKHGDACALASFCVQHRTGRVIEEISKRLGVVGPCYCMARLFAMGDFCQDIRDSLEAYLSHPDHGLQVVTALSEPPAMPRFERMLMEWLFVKEYGHGEDDDAAANRRTLSEHVLAFFPGSWSQRRISHVCPAGCCGPEPVSDRAESIKRAVTLLERSIFQSVDLPALNKWTTVARSMAKVCLQVSFFDVLDKAMTHTLAKRNKRSRLDDDVSDFSDGEIVGHGQDDIRTMRKKATRRQRIVLTFIQSKWTFHKLLMWLSVCEPVMIIHYRLFKFGTWRSHCADSRVGIFAFCGADSPAIAAFRSLTGMLSPGVRGRSQELLLMQMRFGAMHSWPLAMRDFSGLQSPAD